VRESGRLIPVKTSEVVRFEACDDFVYVHTIGHRYRMGVPLQQIETRLDPSQFVRIHRSHIVNMDHVASMVPYDGSRLRIRLRDSTEITASRQCSRALRDLGSV